MQNALYSSIITGRIPIIIQMRCMSRYSFPCQLGSEPNSPACWEGSSMIHLSKTGVSWRDLIWAMKDEEWAAIRRHLPKQGRGPQRRDDRTVLNGIFHILHTGCHGATCPVVTVHPRPFTIVTFGGENAGFGNASLTLWQPNARTR